MELNKFIETIQRGENDTIEFKVSVSKELVPDACAFLNTEGGTILVGVNDEGKIIGIDDVHHAEQKVSNFINAINPSFQMKTSCIDLSVVDKKGKWILVLEFEKGDKLYSWQNRVWIRIGRNNRPLTINEIVEKASESILILFDEQQSKFSSEVISKKLIENYLRKREEKRTIKSSGTIEENLRRLKVAKGNKATNGGILCFSSNPQHYIPYARVRLIKFESEDSRAYADNKEFDGPLSKIMDDIEKYFAENLKLIGEEITGFKRKEYLEYPLVALREAIANALAHRNYFDASEILIMMFPNKIIIRNPGSFPPGVNISSPIHKARNPMLSNYLYDLGYIDKWGSGIKKIFELCREHPLVSVQFFIYPYYTEVIFSKNTEKVEEKLDDLSKGILLLLDANKELSSTQICKELKKSKPTIILKIGLLLNYGLIKKLGNGPKTTYSRIKE